MKKKVVSAQPEPDYGSQETKNEPIIPANEPKKITSKYIELTDGTVVNSYDIILLNVEDVNNNKFVGTEYRLYLRGKKMTLKLTREDYEIVKKRLLEWE